MKFANVRSIAEQIQEIISGYQTVDGYAVDLRIIELTVLQVASEILAMECTRDINSIYDEGTSQFLTTLKNVPVLFDSDVDMCYSDFGIDYMKLNEGLGIWQVSTMKDQVNPFIHVPNGFLGTFSHLPAFRLEGKIGYFAEDSSRIYYTTNILKKYNIEKVLVKLIANTYDSFIPYQYAPIIIEKAKAILFSQKLPDKVDDNNIQV
jgi:hypothetical protein